MRRHNLFQPSLFLITVALLTVSCRADEVKGCRKHWDKENIDFKTKNCTGEKYSYLPILNGVYCYNNGSGICKAFAGRFEFYFNSFEDKFLEHARESTYVDQYGYHKRVPVSYNIRGDINYVDRSINWAKAYTEKSERVMNLLSIISFNWCAYTEDDFWPYKSSLIDQKSGGRYHIYFYNRQSCIVNKTNNAVQHFNTRFLHKSDLRIDLDYNPTIFAMEDNKALDDKGRAGDIRLVKHKRQHWYEVSYKVVKDPIANISYFVDMGVTQKTPCKIDGQAAGCVLTAKAFNTSLCMDESWHKRDENSKNARMFDPHCGIDEMEISDWAWPMYSRNQTKLFFECDLHNLPRGPKANELFYGLDIEDTSQWELFAKDGFVFSAMTTIPVINATTNKAQPDSVRVLLLYSYYNVPALSKYDEYYPVPYFADYVTTCTNCESSDNATWDLGGRKNTSKEMKNLNYVDDIAYLHQCHTVLIIFGPLYSEQPEDKFNITGDALVGSIDKLGIYEIANAFFAVPDSNTLWVYHRTNWVASYNYKCGTKSGELVTAKKSSNYFPRHGKSQPNVFSGASDYKSSEQYDISEETLFQAIGVYKGSIEPEAPDPKDFPLGDSKPDQPQEEKSNMLVYIIIGIGAFLILAMCVACLMNFRRRSRRRRRGLGNELTKRSSVGSDLSASPSKRSSLSTPGRSQGSGLSRATSRSGMRIGMGSSGGIPSARSSLKSNASSPGVPTIANNTVRSRNSGHISRPGASVRSSGLKGSSSASHPTTSRNTRRSSLSSGKHSAK